MAVTRWLLVLLLVLGCAVRKHEPKGETQPLVERTSLPEGIVVSRNKLYLAKSDPAHLTAGEENEVSYYVVDADFEAVDLTKMKIEITYIMPSMPQMGVFKATPTKVTENELETALDIVHGGDWRVTITLTPEGATDPEVLVFDYDVKK